MRIVAILALPVMMAAAPAPERPAPTAVEPVCQNSGLHQVEQRKEPLRAHKLAAEPPAKEILTVLRTIDGCSKPVVVREDVGAPARP